MISALDRRRALELIEEAHQAGARLQPACAVVGISARTYQRWTRAGGISADARPETLRPVPANRLTEAERHRILAICHRSEFSQCAAEPDRAGVG